jgi:nitroreductase
MSTPTLVQPLTVPEAIIARHSVRKYKPGPVPAQDLEEILRLTSLAPSSANFQPWRFVVIQNPALQAELQTHAYNQAQVGAAPVLIVLYVDMDDTLDTLREVIHPGMPEADREAAYQRFHGAFASKTQQELQAFGSSQAGIAMGYLFLAAQALGYATSPMLGFDAQKFKERLDLPTNAVIPAIISLGVADEPGFSSHRHALSRIVRHIGPDDAG